MNDEKNVDEKSASKRLEMKALIKRMKEINKDVDYIYIEIGELL